MDLSSSRYVFKESISEVFHKFSIQPLNPISEKTLPGNTKPKGEKRTKKATQKWLGRGGYMLVS